jgi:hypothetical protein
LITLITHLALSKGNMACRIIAEAGCKAER